MRAKGANLDAELRSHSQQALLEPGLGARSPPAVRGSHLLPTFWSSLAAEVRLSVSHFAESLLRLKEGNAPLPLSKHSLKQKLNLRQFLIMSRELKMQKSSLASSKSPF